LFVLPTQIKAIGHVILAEKHVRHLRKHSEKTATTHQRSMSKSIGVSNYFTYRAKISSNMRNFFVSITLLWYECGCTRCLLLVI